jgi:hypothetical protein
MRGSYIVVAADTEFRNAERDREENEPRPHETFVSYESPRRRHPPQFCINRPEAKNALNMAARQQLAEHFRQRLRTRACAPCSHTAEMRASCRADIREFAAASPIEMYLRHTEKLWDAVARCPETDRRRRQRVRPLGGGCEAVKLGLGYPQGPLSWGDALGPGTAQHDTVAHVGNDR